MKHLKYKILIIGCLFVFTTSCETDDIEPKHIDDSLFWVSFTETTLSVSENDPTLITARVALSAATQSTEVPLTYSVTSPDGAVEGTDYTLPAGFGSATIPAGKHFIDLQMATLINDDIVEGDKTLVFTIDTAQNFNVGLPNTKDGNTYTLVIKEDDFTFIKGTSFEEPAGGTGYTDLETNEFDHDLTNNPGDASVDFVSMGGEIGFDATFVATRVFNTPNGLDDEAIGVLNTPPFGVASFTNGGQGYSFSDTDGIIQVTFDSVDLSGFAESFVSLDVFVVNTSYETTSEAPDAVRISVIADGQTFSMLDLEADNPAKDFANYAGLGIWQELQLDLTGFDSAQLVVEVDVNVNGEGVILDNIRFLGL